ncbi:MAG: hypothetical protein RhofKO_38320 [Rhodothermales bacterium]
MLDMRAAVQLSLLLLFVGVHVNAAMAQHLDASKRDSIRHDLRVLMAQREATTADWARRTRLPLRIAQAAGGTIQMQRLSPTGRPIYRRTHNIEAASVTRTDDLYQGTALGIGVTGEGMSLGIWDSGAVRVSHQEFGDRVERIDLADRDDHATHVAGTLVAAGIRSQVRGMAYAATLRSYDWNSDALELGNEAEAGLLVSNHSYGRISGWDFSDTEGTGTQWYWHGDPSVSLTEDYGFGWYDSDAVLFDQVAYTHPYLLPVVSAGNDREDEGPAAGEFRALDENGDWQTYTLADRPIGADGGPDGTDTIAGMAVAKNVLTIGALTSGGRNTTVAGYSSFGPTDDGRIKPDLVGFGERLFSATAEADNSYGFLTGTSMATPNVAGSLILLQQYHQHWLGSPMRAATLKALAIHTADDLGRQGPDYATGWGRLNTLQAGQQIDDALTTPSALLEAVLDDGGTYTLPITVDTDQVLRVTLAWTDPPSTRRSITANALNDRRPHLIHDLDLRLSANGTTYFPYVLDPDNLQLDAQTGDNQVDPVEQVRFVAPAGNYLITVSHKGTLTTGAQPFSLVVSGGYSERRPVPILQLTSEVEGNTVDLAWSTPFEQATGAFQVERAPITFPDGSTRQIGTFQGVGTVATRGVTMDEQRYTFTEANVEAGRYLYRIRFADGSTSYVGNQTETVVLSQADYERVDLYPNPTRDRTLVSFGLERRRRVQIDVFDALGRRVASVFDGILDAGRHIQYVTPGDWARGLYTIQIRTRDGVRSRSFIYLP